MQFPPAVRERRWIDNQGGDLGVFQDIRLVVGGTEGMQGREADASDQGGSVDGESVDTVRRQLSDTIAASQAEIPERSAMRATRSPNAR